jgi:hypothetical protein
MSASMGGGLFSLFGVGVAALGLFFSIYEFGRAEKYEAAQGEYRERRNNMMRENEAIEEPDLNPFPNDERSDEQPLHSIFK